MATRCCHHPDREAVGTCFYCERSLCDECLSSNRQGKAYCRREEDCLAFQDDQASTGAPTSPILDYITDTYSLEEQVNRLSEILKELGELSALFEDVGEVPHTEGDPRIAGFCAHKLAEEAAALLGLISFRVDCLHREHEREMDSRIAERVQEVSEFIEQEAGPRIRASLDRTGPYAGLDASELLASMRAQAQAQSS